MYWGWRPWIACVFMSVLIAGCTTSSESAPTPAPTDYPPVTLTQRPPRSYAPIAPTPSRQFDLPYIMQEMLTPTTPLTTYTVQPGDTLSEIALRFGIDLDTLQFVNGGIDPIGLQAGQILLIPPPGVTLDTLVVHSTPTPLALIVQMPTCYDADTEVVLCLGSVENPYPVPVERVVISAQIQDAQQRIMQEVWVDVEQQVIPVGGSAPYGIRFEGDWSEVAGMALLLRAADAAPAYQQRYVRLEVSEDAGQQQEQQYIVSLRVANAGPRSAAPPRVTVTVRDAEGHVVGYRTVQSTALLPAGEALALRIVTYTQASHSLPLSHTIHVEALLAAE